MAISLVGNASNAVKNGGDVTVTLPGGIAEDDLVVAGCALGAPSDQTMAMVTSGYTKVADLYANDNLDTNLGAYHKLQGATPDSTAVFDGLGSNQTGTAAAVEVLRGIDTSTPLDQTTTTDSSSNDSIPDPPSITTQTDGAWVVAIGATGHPDNPATAPSGYSNLIEDYIDETYDGNVMMATKEVSTAGAEDPGAFGGITSSGFYAWCAATMAIKPAAGGGGFTLTADGGSFTISGTAAALEYGYALDAGAGSFTLSGQDATLSKGLMLAGEGGSYTLSGQDATLTLDYVLDAEAGAFTISGQPAGLEYGYRLTAEAAAYILSGQDAALEYGFAIDAEAGAITLSGQPASLEYGYSLTAEAGSYTISGQDAGLNLGISLNAEAGAYTLSGQAASLVWGRALDAEAGAYTLSGQDATLTLGSNIVLSAEAGAYLLTGADATLTYAAGGYRYPIEIYRRRRKSR